MKTTFEMGGLQIPWWTRQVRVWFRKVAEHAKYREIHTLVQYGAGCGLSAGSSWCTELRIGLLCCVALTNLQCRCFVQGWIIFLHIVGRFIEIHVRALFRLSGIALTQHNYVRLRNTLYSQVIVTAIMLQFLERKMRKNYVNDVNAERDLLRRSKKISFGNDRREMR